MTDLKPLPERPTLSLPPAAYPARKPPPPPQQPPPESKAEVPKARPIAELDLAERLFHDAMRDSARVTFAFLDGERFDAVPVSIGRYSFAVRTETGEQAIFKNALKWIGRSTPNQLA